MIPAMAAMQPATAPAMPRTILAPPSDGTMVQGRVRRKRRLKDPRMSFPTSPSTDALEQGKTLAPRFDDNGLIAAVATHAETGEVLMLAWMNEEALEKTLDSGEAHYFSRSRGELWH